MNNVKNDFSIWGTKKSINDTELPVHLRYALDTKPTYYKTLKESPERVAKGYSYRSSTIFATREYYNAEIKRLEESGQNFNEVYGEPIYDEDGNRLYWDEEGIEPVYGDLKFIICDWREILFQMALDYRQHDHEDDFLLDLRDTNGRDEQGEWRYPTGKTGYEQYYTDLEGFWRQLYCPPQFIMNNNVSGVWTERDQFKTSTGVVYHVSRDTEGEWVDS